MCVRVPLTGGLYVETDALMLRACCAIEWEMVLGCHGKVQVDRMRAMSCLRVDMYVVYAVCCMNAW